MNEWCGLDEEETASQFTIKNALRSLHGPQKKVGCRYKFMLDPRELNYSVYSSLDFDCLNAETFRNEDYWIIGIIK